MGRKRAQPKAKTAPRRKKEDENTPIELREPERVDMSNDLEECRQLLGRHGYRKTQSTGAAEVWVHAAVPWRITFLADPGGVLRAEIRDPMGNLRTEVRPSYAVDLEGALPPGY